MDIQRETHEGQVVLYIPCHICHNRLFIVDGYPISGPEAEEELRTGFEAHVKDHEAAGETSTVAKSRHR